MDKIKILQINKLYYPAVGGIEKTLQQISEGLNSQADVDVKVLVCQPKGKGCVDTVNGVKVCRSGSLGVIASVPISFSFIYNVRRLSKDRDILQFHLPFPLGDLACLLSGYHGKVVAYWHSDVVKQKRWMFFYRPIMELFLKRADLILVGAKGIIDGSKYLEPYKKKCRVVPFAVSDEILYEGKEYLEKYGYKEKKYGLNFLFIGRLVYYKGCSILVEAFSKLNEDVTLTVIGDGILKEELMQLAASKKIIGKIKFVGHASNEDMKKYMQQADVFILPSVERSEAFGLVQLEAMAYGIPVINTNLASGVPEVSIHGITGLTVEPANVEELVKAMIWMTEHVDERRKMGIEARKRLEENYTQDIMIQNLKEIYSELNEKNA